MTDKENIPESSIDLSKYSEGSIELLARQAQENVERLISREMDVIRKTYIAPILEVLKKDLSLRGVHMQEVYSVFLEGIAREGINFQIQKMSDEQSTPGEGLTILAMATMQKTKVIDPVNNFETTVTGNKALVDLLLSYPDINPNLAKEGGATPLNRTIWYGSIEIAKSIAAHPKTDFTIPENREAYEEAKKRLSRINERNPNLNKFADYANLVRIIEAHHTFQKA